MEPEDIQNELSKLNKSDLYLVLWIIRLRWLRHKASLLKPVHMIFPVFFSEIAILAWAAHAHNVLIAAVGTLASAAIGMFPMLLQPAPLKAHWIRPTL